MPVTPTQNLFDVEFVTVGVLWSADLDWEWLQGQS